MCLAFPAVVTTIEGSLGKVDFGGVSRHISLALVPGVAIGDYVLVHAGTAIEIIDLDEAEQTLAFIRDVFGDEDNVFIPGGELTNA
jgi:hydrogenase expression/formation protein HypC